MREMKKMMMMGTLLLMVTGCTGMGGMIEEKDGTDGTVKVYPSLSRQKALEVAKVVLKEQGADSFEESSEYVIGSFYVNLITPGSFCGIYPKEVAGGGCEVRAVSRRKSAVSVFTGLTEGGFHDAFSEKLKSVANR